MTKVQNSDKTMLFIVHVMGPQTDGTSNSDCRTAVPSNQKLQSRMYSDYRSYTPPPKKNSFSPLITRHTAGCNINKVLPLNLVASQGIIISTKASMVFRVIIKTDDSESRNSSYKCNNPTIHQFSSHTWGLVQYRHLIAYLRCIISFSK
jgi:hypothetical protein